MSPTTFQRILAAGFLFATLLSQAKAKDHWTELNIGPYYVATDGDVVAARNTLVQLEQLRWVLGNLLESKDLQSLWPIRLMLSDKSGPAEESGRFVLRGSQYLLVASPKARLPLGEVAGLLLDANTPRLPEQVESGMRQLFSTLQAHGSRVTWGTSPSAPNLDWARMQLFATKFEYGTSFHIFLTSLRGGSTLTAAERNAFGKSSASLEQEAQANLVAGNWQATPVSGRPLDPKRDFGEHSLDSAVADVYLADSRLKSDPKGAEAAYKAAVEAGGAAAPLGYEGLAALAKLNGENPQVELDNAIRAGSHSAPVYVAAAESLPAAEALPLLKRAAQLNERWAEPIYLQVQFEQTPAEKESLLKTALKLEPRQTVYWTELAQLQTESGEGTAAQGSWLRAADSAATPAERDRIHQLASASEQERLNASEAARKRDREAVHLADEQAQQAEEARIRAAEQKANQSLARASGEQKSDDAVPWNSLAQEKKFTGTLIHIDCLKTGWRLSVKDRAGHQNKFFLSKDIDAQLTCGAQVRPLRISLEYRSTPDADLHTDGEITNLQIQ